MAGRKRRLDRLFSSSEGSGNLSSSSTSDSKNSRRQVTVTTFEKWQRNFDRDHATLTWLKFERDKYDRSLVESLWCSACRQFMNRINSMKNYSAACVVGSTNQRTSNIVDHASSEQHKLAMQLLRTAQAKASNLPVTSYAPIAKALVTLQEPEQAKLRHKFDMCYFLVKQGLSFEKYSALCELEDRHQVDIGNAYRTPIAARQFTRYIAQTLRNDFLDDLSDKKFYSFLMDGSTDTAKIEQELVVLLTFIKNDVTEEIQSRSRFFAMVPPESATSDGLVKCLSQALSPVTCGDDVLQQDNILGNATKPALVGGGTDGASVNIGEQNGMKGMMCNANPWLMWSWCFVHRLELACKNALSSRLFKDIVEMLLRLYYLYEKSPKKVRELMDIITDLKEVFELPSGGNIPVRSHGSRWIGHKRKALLRIVDRCGAYMAHLTALTEDSSVKPDDKARLKGYLRKWMQFRIMLGCALYADILKPACLLSLSLQNQSMDIVLGIKNILKAVTGLNSLTKLDYSEWPTVKLFLGRLKKENEQITYQGAHLLNCDSEVKASCKDCALKDLRSLDTNLQTQLAWSDKDLLRALLVFLETQTWIKRGTAGSASSSADSLLKDDDTLDDPSLAEVKEAVELISTRFRIPLEVKGFTFITLHDKIEEVVDYARKYLNIGVVQYRKVWYRLFCCPDSQKWSNVLVLCELAFSLPFSNGRVEQIFSSMKVLKTDRRANMQSDTLNDIVEIYVEGPPLASFSPDKAIELWWKDCSTTRRVNQQPRKEYRKRSSCSSTSCLTQDEAQGESDNEVSVVDMWDNWLKD